MASPPDPKVTVEIPAQVLKEIQENTQPQMASPPDPKATVKNSAQVLKQIQENTQPQMASPPDPKATVKNSAQVLKQIQENTQRQKEIAEARFREQQLAQQQAAARERVLRLPQIDTRGPLFDYHAARQEMIRLPYVTESRKYGFENRMLEEMSSGDMSSLFFLSQVDKRTNRRVFEEMMEVGERTKQESFKKWESIDTDLQYSNAAHGVNFFTEMVSLGKAKSAGGGAPMGGQTVSNILDRIFQWGSETLGVESWKKTQRQGIAKDSREVDADMMDAMNDYLSSQMLQSPMALQTIKNLQRTAQARVLASYSLHGRHMQAYGYGRGLGMDFATSMQFTERAAEGVGTVQGLFEGGGGQGISRGGESKIKKEFESEIEQQKQGVLAAWGVLGETAEEVSLRQVSGMLGTMYKIRKGTSGTIEATEKALGPIVAPTVAERLFNAVKRLFNVDKTPTEQFDDRIIKAEQYKTQLEQTVKQQKENRKKITAHYEEFKKDPAKYITGKRVENAAKLRQNIKKETELAKIKDYRLEDYIGKLKSNRNLSIPKVKARVEARVEELQKLRVENAAKLRQNIKKETELAKIEDDRLEKQLKLFKTEGSYRKPLIQTISEWKRRGMDEKIAGQIFSAPTKFAGIDTKEKDKPGKERFIADIRMKELEQVFSRAVKVGVTDARIHEAIGLEMTKRATYDTSGAIFGSILTAGMYKGQGANRQMQILQENITGRQILTNATDSTYFKMISMATLPNLPGGASALQQMASGTLSADTLTDENNLLNVLFKPGQREEALKARLVGLTNPLKRAIETQTAPDEQGKDKLAELKQKLQENEGDLIKTVSQITKGKNWEKTELGKSLLAMTNLTFTQLGDNVQDTAGLLRSIGVGSPEAIKTLEQERKKEEIQLPKSFGDGMAKATMDGMNKVVEEFLKKEQEIAGPYIKSIAEIGVNVARMFEVNSSYGKPGMPITANSEIIEALKRIAESIEQKTPGTAKKK